MLETSLYFTFFIAFSAFLANRLVVGLRHRRINVKGVIYSHTGKPKMFIVIMIMAGWGLLFGLGMCVVVIAAGLGY